MSYRAEKKEDCLNEYFSRLSDFYSISNNLLRASTEEEFEVWFEKMELIDKRSLYLFIRENYENIPLNHLALIRKRFGAEFYK